MLDEKLKIIKPLYGIDNSKFQPIIRVLKDVHIDLPYANQMPVQRRVSRLLKDITDKYKLSQEKIFKKKSETPLSQY